MHRLDLGTGIATYEPAEPSGEHHHHLLCERCGRVVPFHEVKLERAITELTRRSDFGTSQPTTSRFTVSARAVLSRQLVPDRGAGPADKEA